ncbi:MAG: hypothetical protein OSB69_10445 [Alphaproteobacteria bacterium]|nr:hypothetical protein [Alphaproteobacteria bacterium]
MKAHKFKVGQLVSFGSMGRNQSGPLNFKIIARMPENERGPQYRIKGTSEPFERTVNEVEISGFGPSDE